MSSPHSALRSKIRVWLLEHKYPTTTGGSVGDADILTCVAGRWLSLEVKTGSGVATKKQKRNVHLIRQAGGYGWIVRTLAQAVRAVDLTKRGIHVADELEIEDLVVEPPTQTAKPLTPRSQVFGSPFGTLESLLIAVRENTEAVHRLMNVINGMADGVAGIESEPLPDFLTRPKEPFDDGSGLDAPETEFDYSETVALDQPKRKRGRPPKNATTPAVPARVYRTSRVEDAAGPSSVDDLDFGGTTLDELPGLTPDNPPPAAAPAVPIDADLGDFADLLEGI